MGAERDHLAVAVAPPGEVEEELGEARVVDGDGDREPIAAVGRVAVAVGDGRGAPGSVAGWREIPPAQDEAVGVAERDVLVAGAPRQRG